MTKTLILIPSRMAATRLPGKPLLKINNLSIISHVFKRAEEANIGDIAMGVVSTAPALIMNEGLEGGQAIALKGRVPVRVTGPVKKGQAVYVHNDGCASTIINGGTLVGIALASDMHEEEKLVECVLKV